MVKLLTLLRGGSEEYILKLVASKCRGNPTPIHPYPTGTPYRGSCTPDPRFLSSPEPNPRIPQLIRGRFASWGSGGTGGCLLGAGISNITLETSFKRLTLDCVKTTESNGSPVKWGRVLYGPKIDMIYSLGTVESETRGLWLSYSGGEQNTTGGLPTHISVS